MNVCLCFRVAGVRMFQEWIRYRYGVFPEHGFPNDAMYPEYYDLGPIKRKNEGCNTTLTFLGDETDSSTANNTGNIRQMVSCV